MLVIGMAAIVGCAGVSKEQYQAQQAEVTKYQQAAEEQSSKNAELEQRVTALEQQKQALQSQNKTLQSQNETIQSSTADLEKKLEVSSAATTALEEKRPVKVNQAVLFKENSSKITPEGKRSLDSIGDALATTKDKAVVVSGFTDGAEGAGNDSRRWQLSSARALEVAKYLAGRGVDASLIAVAGFGQARPVAPNDSLANRALNRRVEILLSPANQDVMTIDVKPAEFNQGGTGRGQGQ
ncbi:MAG TPA: OmpA family protein [Anaeromyxobacteraceae bacterium]|nr:OmpA family protein [Anaeromyxobacteraceae bacterium]